MNNSKDIYEPHLRLREFSLPPGGDWTPRPAGWSLIQLKEGAGYYLQAALNRDLETGAVLVVAGAATGTIRASQLGGVTLQSFDVIPARLTGLITLGEQRLFESAATTKESTGRILPPTHRLAILMRDAAAEKNRAGLPCRLRLLGLFVELFAKELAQAAPVAKAGDARKRLQDFLEQTPSSELLEMNFDELAQMTHCTPRHLSRIFHNLTGVSFRDQRSELRLVRARELLATTNSKVVDVALESGYRSLSLFNLMFSRRFGLSPARWRKQNGKLTSREHNDETRLKQPALAKDALSLFAGGANRAMPGKKPKPVFQIFSALP